MLRVNGCKDLTSLISHTLGTLLRSHMHYTHNQHTHNAHAHAHTMHTHAYAHTICYTHPRACARAHTHTHTPRTHVRWNLIGQPRDLTVLFLILILCDKIRRISSCLVIACSALQLVLHMQIQCIVCVFVVEMYCLRVWKFVCTSG
jgi:hypothetical protein